jgi:hypothetical protein
MADTWDEEEDNATAERIAATDRVVAQLIANIDAEFAAEDTARGSANIFNRGRILFKAKHQLNVRG